MNAETLRATDGELPLRMKAAKAVNRDSVEELCGLLRGRGWVLCSHLRELRPDWNERFIRLLANTAGRRIVSGPGMPGYCLAEEVALDDLIHAGRSLTSQGRMMMERGIGYMQLVALRRAQELMTSGGAQP